DGFRNNFINRFADLLNTIMQPAYFSNVINTIYNQIQPYLNEDTNRYPRLTFYRESERTNLLNWANNRPAFERENIRTHFNIESTLNVTLNVSNIQAGNVKINTILIDGITPGVTANPYPWSGIYYKNIPVTLSAV
ncbi:CotH kinase family protein, partial [Arthrospira platensis SPKY2]